MGGWSDEDGGVDGEQGGATGGPSCTCCLPYLGGEEWTPRADGIGRPPQPQSQDSTAHQSTNHKPQTQSKKWLGLREVFLFFPDHFSSDWIIYAGWGLTLQDVPVSFTVGVTALTHGTFAAACHGVGDSVLTALKVFDLVGPVPAAGHLLGPVPEDRRLLPIKAH